MAGVSGTCTVNMFSTDVKFLCWGIYPTDIEVVFPNLCLGMLTGISVVSKNEQKLNYFCSYCNC